ARLTVSPPGRGSRFPGCRPGLVLSWGAARLGAHNACRRFCEATRTLAMTKRKRLLAPVLLIAVVVALLSAFEITRIRRTNAALEALGPADASSVPMLIELLNDYDYMIRAAAARTLARIGPAARDAVP